MGSCVPRHIMSAELAPHCWNATSFADPEYVMDFRSPNAFCASAITVFASCATALPPRNATQIAATASFGNTASPFNLIARRNAPALSIISTRPLVGVIAAWPHMVGRARERGAELVL